MIAGGEIVGWQNKLHGGGDDEFAIPGGTFPEEIGMPVARSAIQCRCLRRIDNPASLVVFQFVTGEFQSAGNRDLACG